ncbi:PREDICTED: dynein heavy chain 17, axonemal, partial [Condylura cristata]|uniref:dynein heavy chain 17, axonemal n=1 Tax=Condylura cristata TaxID=143302 RepID=UPI000643225D
MALAQDARVEHLEAVASLLLKVKPDKWSKMLGVEENAALLTEFLDKPEARVLVLTLHPSGAIVPCLGFPAALKSKGIYFLKKKPSGITKNNYKDLIYGDISPAPVEQLIAIVEEVLYSLLNQSENTDGWPQVVSEDIVKQVHKLKNEMFVMGGKIKGKTLLPIPEHLESLDGPLESTDRISSLDNALLHAIETIVIDWSHQIRDVLSKDSAQALLDGLNPLPQVEFEFWEARLTNLKCIHEQLLYMCGGLLERPLILAEVVPRYTVMLELFDAQLDKVKVLYDAQVAATAEGHSPPIHRNMSPVAGQLKWSLELQERLEAPLRDLKRIDHPVMSSAEATLVYQKHEEMMALLRDYREDIYRRWAARVDRDCQFNLGQPLIQRDPGTGLIRVNFSREALGFLVEPELERRLCPGVLLRTKSDFRKATLVSATRWPGTTSFPIKTTVVDVEFPLIKAELEAIDVKLLSAETTLFWNGEGVLEYVQGMREILHDLQTRMQKAKQNVDGISQVMKENAELFRADTGSLSWKEYVSYIDSMVLDEFDSFIRKSLNYLIDNMVADLVDYRVEFSRWWINEFKTIKFPSQGTIFDYYIDPDTKKFLPWTDKVPSFELDPDVPLQASLVHTAETIRIRYFMDLLMEKSWPVMLVGNAGTGKSVLMGDKLESLNTDDYLVQAVPFNFYTTSAMLQGVLEKPLEKKSGRNYGPPGTKKLVYFIDDMNMPEVDKYGTVAPHTLIRQHMDHGHWYDRQKLTLKDIHNCQYVACMNPTSGSFTIDPRLQDLGEELLFARPNIFCHFAQGIGDPKYLSVVDMAHLSKLLAEVLDSYNEVNAVMNLVLFEDAVAHICRINRILESPRGNALLVGVGGSGKQSLSRLAAYISALDVFQITLKKGYGIPDLKNVTEKQKACETDLAKAEPALLAAQEALDTLNKNNLTELKSFGSPPDAVVNVTAAPEVKASISLFMAYVHTTVNDMSKVYLATERRYNYTTPKTFLELIKLYQSLLGQKTVELVAKIQRLENGLMKLQSTASQVDDLKAKLAIQEADLKLKNENADKLIQVVGVETEKVSKEKAIADEEEVKVEVINKVRPAPDRAAPPRPSSAAPLGSQSPWDVQVPARRPRSRPVAPEGRGPPPRTRCSPPTLGCPAQARRLPAQDPHLPYQGNPTFDPEFIRSKSTAAAGLCSWCLNIVRFYEVYCDVAPKRQALDEANAELAEAQDKLSRIKNKIAELNANLSNLTSAFEKATAEKIRCQQEADATNRVISLANRLVGGLASENVRWAESVENYKSRGVTLCGDVLLISAFVSYVGYFTKKYRNELMDKFWIPYINQLKVPIPITKGLDPLSLLTDDADVATWNNQGLPSDRMSTENATILCSTERWPLIVDAQLQGIKWIKNKYGNSLKAIRLGQKSYLDIIEQAISEGDTLLIENIGETVDPVLDPLLGRNTIKKGNSQRFHLPSTPLSPAPPAPGSRWRDLAFPRPDGHWRSHRRTAPARASYGPPRAVAAAQAFNVVFEKAIQRTAPADDIRQRVMNLTDEITYSVYMYTARGLFERDKLIFLAQVAFQVLSTKKELNPMELDFLLRFPFRAGLVSPVDFLQHQGWGGIKALAEMDEFKNLDSDIEGSAKRWKKLVESEAPEKEVFPKEWKNKTALQKLCMVRCMRPDRMTYAVKNFVEEKMGSKFVEGRSVEFAKSYEESSASTPIFFILSPGVDPLKDVEALGKKLGFTIDNGKLHNVSLGQGQEVVAENALDEAASNGHWVILQNIHLVARWLGTLDKKVELYSSGSHEHYRVFMSAEPAPSPESHIIPQGILENAIKITNEPPTGMHANLHKALDLFTQDTLEMCTKEIEFKCILFALCYFHAVVAERRKFGAQGWNRSYPFNNGDLTISVNVLYNYLEANPKVPWDDLRYLFGEIMYGGHITDDWDRRLCRTYLGEYIRAEMLEGETLLAPGFLIPPNLDYKVKAVLDEILDKIPEAFNMAEIVAKAAEKTPYVVVAFQECERMNILTNEMRRSLKELSLGLKGELTITTDMEDLSAALFYDTVPSTWEARAYPSMMGLAAWYADLLLRIRELEAWTTDFALPTTVWLAGFFNPQSFLTAIMQSMARKNEWPLDKMCLSVEVTKKNREDMTAPPRE